MQFLCDFNDKNIILYISYTNTKMLSDTNFNNNLKIFFENIIAMYF